MLFSMAILATVGAFGVKKFLVMKDYEETIHQTKTIINENFLEDQDERVSMANFDIAVTISRIDSQLEIIDLSDHFEWSVLD